MEKKQSIFAKLNMKDYTNRLEKILEKKDYSIDSKNLLLSMFYKIENAYEDYEKTKVEVPSKLEYLNHLLAIIEYTCKSITVAEFDSSASELLEKEQKSFLISKNDGSIVAYGNEVLLLNCIFKLAKQEIVFPEERSELAYAMNALLTTGNVMNQVEVIRDFNGWSWDVGTKEIENIPINLAYQSMLYLLGRIFLEDWLKNQTKLADYIGLMEEHLKEQYGEKRQKKLVLLLYQIAINQAMAENEEQKKLFLNLKEKAKEEYALLRNQKEYLHQMTQKKKELTKQIETIDRIRNDKQLLQAEYSKRNENLPNKQKIFSLGRFDKILAEERMQILTQIKECNECIDPTKFVSRKEKVKNQADFYCSLCFEKEVPEKTLLDLCQSFLECFQIKISKAQTKKEIICYLYELRYFRNLPIHAQGKLLKDCKVLENAFAKTIHICLQKANKLGAIDFVTEDEQANEQILSAIFDSRFIDFDHLIILTMVEEEKLFIEYYDGNVLEKRTQLQIDRTIKLKRKTRVLL